MEFVALAEASAAVAATTSRKAKVELLATALRRLAPTEIEAGAAFLSGELRQRQTGVGWASLQSLPPPAESASLTVADVDRAATELAAVAGAGSRSRRRAALDRLFAAATVPEQVLLRGLFSGELRQGAAAGVLVEAVARAGGVSAPAVRRALLLAGDLPAVAVAALTDGAAGLAGFALRVGTPLAPMLAASAATPAAALATTGAPALVDVKLDGVRIQVHVEGEQIAVFSRSLDVITDRMPEVVAAARELPVRQAVLDGEALALDAAGRPRPFQETSGRAATRLRSERVAASPAAGPAGLSPFFFDILHLDGEDLLDRPLAERSAALVASLPPDRRVSRATVADDDEAAARFAAAVAAGQEGVVVKSLAAGYDAGRRGSAWVKVKPRHTLDLVVLAAEWGHGRRHGWLSNLHLGARDAEGGSFVMLGKTFKGLTDELLRWQTERLRGLAVASTEWLVRVRPELVVEIAFDGVQRSDRYPGGVALRFARVLRYREDKPAAEADTIEAVRRIYLASHGTDATPS
ncbi:ATP-dependent DNA ligase [Natronosporangium hydrolyticum]|uniref:DNA ligase n=1 Tax=Natronosporangium hydrolyticum TaxID=2811111 RepID=A0A895Y7H3_9ACTN|nr:ATP-dependent DNA ligase [Natronosporangium hydrolyticum]QSB13684.1 ATP-dependent DNA ligase [Natronosporangium hydrolyticum]